MPRAVIVYFHATVDGPPVEIGRATLDSQGHAVVSGFTDVVRQQYEELGIYLNEDRMVPLSDGNTFLDVLL
jgi:hypothetical protein